MIKSRWCLAALTLSGAAVLTGVSPGSGLAQVPAAQVRALNLARNTAVKENGGLSVYRPQACMFQTSSGGETCLIQNNANGFTYRFLGGEPGWPEDNSPATTETEIQIAPDGYTVQRMLYNGEPR